MTNYTIKNKNISIDEIYDIDFKNKTIIFKPEGKIKQTIKISNIAILKACPYIYQQISMYERQRISMMI